MSFSRQSVSYWIASLKEGDENAVQQLWNRYSTRLIELAQQRLRYSPKRMADEEDVALSVFHSLCQGATKGRFQNVTDRDDLWWLLLGITRDKTIDHNRREFAHKRGEGKIFTESELGSNGEADSRFLLDQLIGDEPTPDFVLALDEQFNHLLRILRDDDLRKIALLRIEGYTMQEIADQMGTALRTIERKTRLIRSRWRLEV